MSRKLERDGKRVLPGLWQLNKTTWVVRAQRKCPLTGRKCNRRRLVLGATRAEALLVLETLRGELRRAAAASEPTATQAVTGGTSPDTTATQAVTMATSPETLACFATSWLKLKRERKDLAPSTAKRYATALDRLSAKLKDSLLADIGKKDIEQWMVAATKTFDPVTINGWLRVLRACLNDAVADGKLPRNPATLVKPLKTRVDLENTNSLAPDALYGLLCELARQNYTIYAIALTMALTGLRWGEATALKWIDYDEDRSVLRIRRSVCDRELRPLTKSEKARIVGVPQVLVRVLREHRVHVAGRPAIERDSGLLFPSRKGTPLGSGRISDALRETCKALGIGQRFTSHGFRRSLTDLLRNAQVDPVIAAGLTGHETERMRKHYSTVREQEAVDAGERVARLVQPSWESSAESTEESTARVTKKASSD